MRKMAMEEASGGDAGWLDFVSSSKDGHTGGGVVVFVGTEMREAEKSRRGERERWR